MIFLYEFPHGVSMDVGYANVYICNLLGILVILIEVKVFLVGVDFWTSKLINSEDHVYLY